MYVWFAIGLERQLQELRRALVEIEKKAGREDPALTLPMHCSLKISFEIDGDERDKLYDMLTEYFEKQKAFFVKPCSFETLGKLCWLSIEPCAELVRIHAELDALLYERFGVLQHEFDLDFKYHATLFADSSDVLDELLSLERRMALPKELLCESFIIGSSESGVPGTYKVDRIIKAKAQ